VETLLEREAFDKGALGKGKSNPTERGRSLSERGENRSQNETTQEEAKK
jgi:hypothetical protein